MKHFKKFNLRKHDHLKIISKKNLIMMRSAQQRLDHFEVCTD